MTIYVDKTDTRITLRGTRPVRGLQSMFFGAAYFSQSKGCWTLPLDLETFSILTGSKLSRELEISDRLWKWVLQTRENRTALVNTASGRNRPELTRVPRVAPELARALATRAYQMDAVNFGKQTRAFLIADDPGLGKTLMAMGTVIELGIPGPYLVVCPKTAVESVWRNELEHWLPRANIVTMAEYQRAGREEILAQRFGKRTWVVINPEMLLTKSYWMCWKCEHLTRYTRRKIPVLECGHMRRNNSERFDEHRYPQLFENPWSVVIVDESHECLIRKPGEPTQRRLGLEVLPIRRNALRLALSGTPMRGKPYQLWGTLNWLNSKKYGGYWRWVGGFWELGGFSGYQVMGLRKDREHLLWDSLNDIVVRRTKAEVAKDLPPKQYVGTPILEGMPNAVLLPMESKQQRAYEEMLTHSSARLGKSRIEAISPIAELTRLRQFAASYGRMHKGRFVPILPSNKFTWLIERMEEWGWPRDPDCNIVIVSQFTKLLDLFGSALDKHFKHPLSLYITGNTPIVDRRSILNKFERYERKALMMNIKAGGTSITIDNADRMIFLSRSPIPDVETQAEDRLHRISKPRSVQYYYLHSVDTVDIGTAIVNSDMDKQALALLNRNDQREYAKRVIELSSNFNSHL